MAEGKGLTIWGYCYDDIHPGLVFLLAIAPAIVVVQLLHLGIIPSVWLCVPAVLCGLTLTGNNKKQQSLYYFKFLWLAAVAITLSLFMHDALLSVHPYLLYVITAIIVFAVFSLSLVIRQLIMAVGVIAVFVVIPSSFVHPAQTVAIDIASTLVPMSAGIFLSFVANLILPSVVIPLPDLKDKHYLLIRSLRIAIATVLLMAFCHWVGLTHPAWAIISAIFVSQATLGATVRKSWQRLLGTALGVVAAAPLGFYVFQPFPSSRFLVLLLLFIMMAVGKKSYPAAIFIGTICFGALFFVISPAGQGLWWFIGERLLETALGVVTIVLLEIIIYPRSVVKIMRQHSQQYWHYLAVAISASNQDERSKAFFQTKIELNELQDKLIEFRYEPLTFMSRRFHNSQKLVNHLFHYRLLFAKSYHQEKEVAHIPERFLHSIYEKLSQQYKLTFSDRLDFLAKLIEDVEKTITDYPEYQDSALVEKLLHIIMRYQQMLASKQFSPLLKRD